MDRLNVGQINKVNNKLGEKIVWTTFKLTKSSHEERADATLKQHLHFQINWLGRKQTYVSQQASFMAKVTKSHIISINQDNLKNEKKEDFGMTYILDMKISF